MKKTVLTFGLLSGAVSSGMMLLTVPLIERIGFDEAELLGYTTIVASFLLVFFGIRSYREHVSPAPLTFGRACAVGLLITIVSSACYTATWQVVSRTVAPDFVEKYTAHLMAQATASGATAAELEEKTRQMASMKAMLDNPAINVAVTFLEPFPIGVLVTLISAAVLRRTNGAPAPARSAV